MGRPTLRLLLSTTAVIFMAFCTADEPDLKAIVAELAKQVQYQRFALEEKTRTDGGSGLKQQAVNILGSRSWATQTHTGMKIATIHDHANNKFIVGMGEATFVINGVEFRTRHNDYPLYMPHRTSSAYNAVEKIPHPEVPPAVLAKRTVPEQVEEMRLWLKAFADQDYSVRDYRPYFKPVLCYMEAGWSAQTVKLEESFESDRHFIEASTWEELHTKVRYMSYTGRKNLLENLAYLPRTIFNVTEDGRPVYAQWNYRILCHPLANDLPFSYLKQEDDLQARFIRKKSFEEFKLSRGARFRLEKPGERNNPNTLLEDLMSEIPGRDNYQGNINDLDLGDEILVPKFRNKTLLNVAYFHRTYKLGAKDASGKTVNKRGYSDPTLFVAETTQPKIAPVYVRDCHYKKGRNVPCLESTKRVTYAIPLEIIYLTPLMTWNPHNILYKARASAQEVTEGGTRRGGFSNETAYRLNTVNNFYRTPAELFGEESEKDLADTAVQMLGFLDSKGQFQKVSPSGVRTLLPKIKEIGHIRTRWPIMPIHGEGGAVWKELNALKAVVMDLKKNGRYLHEPLPIGGQPQEKTRRVPVGYTFKTHPSNIDRHLHYVNITQAERNRLKDGEQLNMITTINKGHSHNITIGATGRFDINLIDGGPPPSKDGHNYRLRLHRTYY